jgi:glycosyltransferase involved in cell wall biosynthesis
MNKKLHIAYLLQNIAMDLASSQSAPLLIRHIAAGLEKAGHHVTFAVLRPGRRVICEDKLEAVWREDVQARTGQLGISGSWSFWVLESAIRRTQTELHFPYFGIFDSYRFCEACCKNLKQVDLLHEYHMMYGLGGALAARRMKCPLVLQVDADPILEQDVMGRPVRGVQRLFARWVMKVRLDAAQAITCVSEELKTHLVQSWGVSAGKVHVTPNAVDVEAFGNGSGSAAWQQRLNPTNDPLVIFVGGFYVWHALDLLVESFAKVLEQVPKARLLLVGDGDTRPMVEEVIERHGIRDSITMAGPVPHCDIPGILALADVAVVSTYLSTHNVNSHNRFGSPMKLFEYMAAGKAIVATDAGQIAQVIRHGHNGVLVPAGDPDQFAQAIVALLKDPVERARLGENARKQAVERHSWQQYIKELEQVYQSVL